MQNRNWRLEDIYPDEHRWEQDLQTVTELLNDFVSYQNRLGTSADTLLAALQARDRIRELTSRVCNYASMKLDEDNTNPEAQARRDRATALETRVEAALSFLVPELLSLPEATLAEFRKEKPGLDLYSFELDDLLRFKPHTLSTAEERLVAGAGEILQAPNQIFNMLNHADLTFPTILDDDGREIQVTHGNYPVLMQSSNRRLRRDAFTALYGTYGRLANTLASIFNTGVRRDIFLAREHHYRSSLAAALHAENVPEEVYRNLIQAVRAHLGSLHRYMALRKQRLGLEELHMYDIYAPLVTGVDWPLAYPEAVDLVERGLAALGDTYRETLARGLRSGWVDVEERPGKTSGAYCEGVYGVHPYVLLNYQNNLDSAFTLAHEMGHALHFYFSEKNQPFTYAQPSIFTTEVASTVNEVLLVEYLLQTETQRERRLYLLNYYLELFRVTLFRQTMFAEFESQVHARAERGEAITAQVLKGIYHRLNQDYHGPAMVVDAAIDLEWARIPHFYNPFYVYKYATGLSAAVAIVRRIWREGRPAVDDYHAFLKSGSSNHPIELLKLAGIDLSQPRPVQEALQRFDYLLDELAKL